MRNKLLLSFSILLLAGPGLSAQNPYIHHYNTQDGLPSNTIYYVFQDSKKFIWFATDAGIVRYDGSSYINYREKDGLSSNEVVRIKEDSFGRLWIINLNGALNYIQKNKIFNGSNAPFLDSLKSLAFFRNFFQDDDKTIYFYYNHNRDIFALDSGNHVKKFKIESRIIKLKWFVPYEGMVTRHIGKSPTGEFLIWTSLGLFKLKNFNEKPIMVSDTCHALEAYPARNNTCYLALHLNEDADENLKNITLGKGRTQIVKLTDEFPVRTDILPFKSALPFTSIVEDNAGFLWVATFDQGVFCLKNNRVIRHLDIKEAQSMMLDHENNIWISSMNDGVYKISPYLNFHRHFDTRMFQGKGITALSPNSTGGIWCTNGSMIYLLLNDYFYPLNFHNKSNSLNFLHSFKNNRLLAGLMNSVSYAFEGLSLDNVTRKIRYKKVNNTSFYIKNLAVSNNEKEIRAVDHYGILTFNPDKLFRDIKVMVTNQC